MSFRGRQNGSGRGQRRNQTGRHKFPTRPRSRDIISDEVKDIQAKLQQFDSSTANDFADFPLSQKTIQGLKACNYKGPTDIQREAIGLALQGNDILGAAKTGSGKTLAFIIPILECMFRERWSSLDGLGALIISPTRELAFQTFNVLKKVGRFHDFSAGLVIGGKNLKEEAGRINQTNIVVCTPGRLLQHMDETIYFRADGLKILVLDEADRILDMGFAQTMNAIIDNLPAERQTMLFSATQTRSVKDLARLSLQNPMFVSVHENATESTPSQLEQSYVVCELHDKLNMLWSFLRNHLKSKILVFLTSCKQVKYVYEAFRRLRPGMTVLALHGSMSQLKRVAVYNQFRFKQNVCLFATDIAARGLDFPAVNWVLQLDCPDDSSTYIHRAGRTARYEKDGESLLVLLPSEEEHMVRQLLERKIPVEKIQVSESKMYKIQHKLEANCAADPVLKEFAQRAFISYLRSIFLMKDKNVFDVHALDVEEFARSLGLGVAPKVRFLKRDQERIKQKETSTSQKLTASKQSKEKTLQSKLKTEQNDTGSDDEEDDSDSDDNDSSEESEEDTDKPSTSKTPKSVSVSRTSDLIEKLKQKLESKRPDSSDESSDDAGGSEGEESSDEEEVETSEDSEHSDSSNEEQAKGEKPQGAKLDFDMEQDDDSLFTVKKNVDINTVLGDEEVVEDEVPESKKKPKKVLTREDIAMRLLRKKIVVNTKVKFDETGQAEIDQLKAPNADIDIERADSYGGINIALARQRMQQEDKIDKEIFRQRVKLKHREERLKRRDENRKKQQQNRYEVDEDDEEGEARLASDEEGGGGDTADPLSFIPDPDEVYGKEGSGDSSEESDYDGPSQAKRSKPSREVAEDSDNSGDGEEDYDSDSDDTDDDGDNTDDDGDDVDDEDDTGVMDTDLSLRDDEALALRLLQKT